MPRIDLEQKRLTPHRGGVSPLTSEWHYTAEETEFALAMERYKRRRCRPFPTCAEVLDVLKSLGYRKTADPVPLPGCQ